MPPSEQPREEPAPSKLYYIGVFKSDVATKSAHELVAENNLGSVNYFKRPTIAQFLTFMTGTVAARTLPGTPNTVEQPDQETKFHSLAHSAGVCGVVATNLDYNSRTAYALLRKVLDEFVTRYPPSAYANFQEGSPKLAYPELKEYILKYQDWTKVDNISQIQKELDETKIVLHKTIDSVLERGEKIDDLVAKSDGLSAQSKLFYTQAKKQNSCCTVM